MHLDLGNLRLPFITLSLSFLLYHFLGGFLKISTRIWGLLILLYNLKWTKKLFSFSLIYKVTPTMTYHFQLSRKLADMQEVFVNEAA